MQIEKSLLIVAGSVGLRINEEKKNYTMIRRRNQINGNEEEESMEVKKCWFKIIEQF